MTLRQYKRSNNMKQGTFIAGLMLTLTFLSFAAKAESPPPIWVQEADQPQQAPRNPGRFYNPDQDMAPPVPGQNRPVYQERQRMGAAPVQAEAQGEIERRRPVFNVPASEEPTKPDEPQPDYIAPKPGEKNGEAVDTDPENAGTEANPDAAPENTEIPVDQEQPKWVEKSQGSFKVLNKVYTRNTEIVVKKGELKKIGALNIKLEKCFRMSESDEKESSALLLISETFTSQPTKEIFHGWMFSSSPAISALEHPLYDVILLGCADEEKKAPEKKEDKKDDKTKKNDSKKNNETKQKTKAAN